MDPECIFIGGSIAKSFELFKESTWDTVKRYILPQKKIMIKASDDPDMTPLLGVKWLYEQSLNSNH